MKFDLWDSTAFGLFLVSAGLSQAKLIGYFEAAIVGMFSPLLRRVATYTMTNGRVAGPIALSSQIEKEIRPWDLKTDSSNRVSISESQFGP